MTQKKLKISPKRINILIRLLVSVLLLWVIYRQVFNTDLPIDEWKTYVKGQWYNNWYFLAIAIFLLPANYLLESLKWYTLVNHFENHRFFSAFKGVLTGLTAALITPARIGDYIGKLMFIQPENNWKAVWANFTSSIAQTLVTLIIGSFGLIILSGKQWDIGIQFQYFLIGFAILFGALLIALYYRLEVLFKLKEKIPETKWTRGLKNSMKVVVDFKRNRLHQVLVFSLIRYMVFLTQYILVLLFWGLKMEWLIPIAISVIYLIQTMVPFPPILSLFVRSEIALLILGGLTENSWLILTAAFSIWIINLLMPSLVGLYYWYQTNITKTLGYED